ncbi:hypothetical protein GCM10020219_003070 [Nonomuraea dietziae]
MASAEMTGTLRTVRDRSSDTRKGSTPTPRSGPKQRSKKVIMSAKRVVRVTSPARATARTMRSVETTAVSRPISTNCITNSTSANQRSGRICAHAAVNPTPETTYRIATKALNPASAAREPSSTSTVHDTTRPSTLAHAGRWCRSESPGT